MASPLRTAVSRMHARRCVRCGYDGALLKEGRAPRCARCGCDLRRRPALTYAEMEGFVGEEARSPRRAEISEAKLIERWLALLVASVLVLVAAAILLTRDL